MSKNKMIFLLCFSLFLAAFEFDTISFAIDVEVSGDLTVDGVINSTSGAFTFPGGNTLSSYSGTNYLVDSGGFVVDSSNSNGGDLTAGALKFGGVASSEGIISQRTVGGNQDGLDFYTNSIARLSITHLYGYVGLGTRAPLFPLDVRVYKGATHARFGPDSGLPLFLIANQPHVGFNVYYSSGYKYGATGPGGYLSFNQTPVGGFTFATTPSGTADATAIMYPRLTITNDGLVGIGTTAPVQTLDVNGSINAAGAITTGGNMTTHVLNATSVTSGPGTFTDPSTDGTGIQGVALTGSYAWGVYGARLMESVSTVCRRVWPPDTS